MNRLGAVLLIPLCMGSTITASRQQQATPGPQKSLYEQVIPNPTRKNGYEEYLRCADLMRTPEAKDYLRALAAIAPTRASGGSRPMPKDLPLWAVGLSVLDIEREVASRLGHHLEWIRLGNNKAVTTPYLEADAFPLVRENAEFNKINRLACAVARVHFADGETHAAIDMLIEQLRFAEHLSHGEPIQNVIACNYRRKVFAVLEPSLAAVSEADLERLREQADAVLAKPPALIEVLGKEQRRTERYVTRLCESPVEAIPEIGFRQVPEPLDRLKTMPLIERQAVRDKMLGLFKNYFGALIASMSGPELVWEEHDIPSSDDEVVETIANLPFWWEFGTSHEAASRTQLRLLRLHCLIQLFRWKNARLPATLMDLKNPEAIIDPLSGAQFAYEPQGLAYQLYSRGSKIFRRVELTKDAQSLPKHPGRYTSPIACSAGLFAP